VEELPQSRTAARRSRPATKFLATSENKAGVAGRLWLIPLASDGPSGLPPESPLCSLDRIVVEIMHICQIPWRNPVAKLEQHRCMHDTIRERLPLLFQSLRGKTCGSR